MAKQSRSGPVMQAVLDAVAERLMNGDESMIRIPEVCEATGINYGSVYHHFGSREGVIDAAYDMIFARLVQEDIALFRQGVEQATTFDEFVAIMQPIVASVSLGPLRRKRRAMRVRIVAAASTRPRLRLLIGQTQARLSSEVRHIIERAQSQGWMREDLGAGALAVLFQIVIFGRTLDDVSVEPVDEGEWEKTMSAVFFELLPR
jgi:AcrR family transcriptional regulator